MTTHHKPYPAIENLIGPFADWLKHRRDLNKMRQLDRGDFERIANELQVSPEDLDSLVHHGLDAADELPKLLKALGIDEATLARAEPLVLRDMKRVCALCRHKRRCNHDLAAGVSANHYRDYCLNASTIDNLTAAE